MVSKQTSELNELMKYNMKYREPYKGQENNHIILLGNITHTSLYKFTKEFFHPDHNLKNEIKIIIIQNCEPSKEIINVLNNPKYENKIQYIIGDIFNEYTLKKAKIKNSQVFIISNQFEEDSKKNDTCALLSTKAIHEYDHNTKIFVQIVDPDYLLHSWADWDVVMSTQNFKMGKFSLIFVH